MLTLLLLLLFLASLAGGVLLSFGISHNADGDFNGFKLKNKLVLPTGLVAAGLFLSLAMGVTSVDAGSRGILKRFGHPVETLEPGLHFVRPIGDTVVTVPVQTRVVKPNEDASSKDLQIVHFEITFRYHIDPSQAMHFLVDLNNDQEDRVIIPAILEAIKSATSQYDVQELISRRTEVRDRIETQIAKSLEGTHIVAESTSITDFRFSKEYEDAIEKKQVAQQKAEQAKNDLDRIRVEAEQAAATAKGESDAKIANATGEAQSVLIVAKAKAEAQRIQRENITPELLQLRTIELLEKNWKGDFPETFMGGGNGLNPVSIILPQPTKREKVVDKQ